MLDYILIATSILTLALVSVLYIRKDKPYKQDRREHEITRSEIKHGFDNIQSQIKIIMDANKNHNESMTRLQTERLNDLRSSVESLDKKLNEKFDRLQQAQTESIKGMMQDNQKQLDKIRGTVDEKLSETLKTKFEESFKLINTQLDKVNKSLVDMQVLANDVGSLNKVLSNVKSRGNWGEMQLESILTNIFSEGQFERNVSTDGSKDRVEFCVVVPDKEKNVLLPIDSKFPLDKYMDVVEAAQTYNKEKVQKAEKELVKAIKDQAKKIKKYINPPKTMDMAIMYLPTEGLYAEVAKQVDLLESIYRDERVFVCGPNTLSAMLNSISIGMKQVAINKRSTEIAKLLNSFKFEFKNFTDLIAKTQKKIDEASSTIADTKKKTETIQKKLNGLSDVTDRELRYLNEDEE